MNREDAVKLLVDHVIVPEGGHVLIADVSIGDLQQALIDLQINFEDAWDNTICDDSGKITLRSEARLTVEGKAQVRSLDQRIRMARNADEARATLFPSNNRQ